MTLAIISDVHGNHEALCRVLDDIDDRGIDDIFCLGDCIGYGPDPEEVIEAVRARNIPALLGNHELAARDRASLSWFNPRARLSLEITVAMLSLASLNYIQKLPSSVTRDDVRFVHGFPPDSVHTYLFQKSDFELTATFNQMAERICFVGHTHDLEIIEFTGRRIKRWPLVPGSSLLNPEYRYIINVGSVGQPRDGSNKAKYVLWDKDDNRIEVRAIPYDIDTVVSKIKARGLPEEHAERLR